MDKRHQNLSFTTIVGYIAVFCLLLSVSNVFASGGYPFLYRGVRVAGMGGAFTAVADDENAFFYNPAGLARTETFYCGILNPLLEFSADSIDLYQDMNDTDMDNTTEVTALLRKYVGEHQHLKASLFPHVGFQAKEVGILLGGLGQGTIDTEIRNPTWPQMDINANVDYAFLGGFGMKVPNLERLKAGIGLKYVHRDTLNETYTAADIANSNFEDEFDDDRHTGSGVSIDLGVLYSIPVDTDFNANVAFVGQNIPGMDMGDANDIDSQYNLGVAIEKMFGKTKFIAAFDYMDLFNNASDDSDFPKHLHMGFELQAPTLLVLDFAFRAGLNQGYLTAGTTIKILKVIKLDLAAYTEEVGTYAGQKDDKRYMAQVSLGW